MTINKVPYTTLTYPMELEIGDVFYWSPTKSVYMITENMSISNKKEAADIITTLFRFNGEDGTGHSVNDIHEDIYLGNIKDSFMSLEEKLIENVKNELHI